MSEKKELHIVSHTHWDREWYMSFSRHRYRLVKLMDELIDVAERDESFKSFHLDGQTIVLDDYIAVRPSMRERLQRLIERGKLKIGPFYILQDEYLVDGESNVRNVVYGLKACREWGEPVMVGYFPDAFGNISQIPQILKGFGIECAYFGRGIVPMGYANTVLGKGDEGFAEIIWEGADKSRVVGIQFINWYHNAMEIPSKKEEAETRFRGIIKSLESITRTPYLLGMNGCDHTPVQRDIGQIIDSVKSVDGVRTVHSDLYTYFKAVEPYKDTFSVYRGEICGQNGNGYYNLINTASSRIYLKQYNVRAQNLLEFRLEPLSVMAQGYGRAYDSEMLDFCWKSLLQNHPHDSICGCSHDDVHREMVVRFKSVIDTATDKADDLKNFIVSRLDVLHDKSLLAFNPDAQTLSGTAEGYVDYAEDEALPDDLSLFDELGAQVPAQIQIERGVQVVELPDDAFRRLYRVNRVRVTFRAENVPPLSVRAYRLKAAKNALPNFKADSRGMENEFYSLKFSDDGTFDFTDKKSGKVYVNCNGFEDTGDKGDEYTYEWDGRLETTSGKKARVELVCQNPFRAEFCVTTALYGTRIASYISGEQGSPLVKINTQIDNDKTDRRIRATFETRIKTDYVTAEGGYDFTRRKIDPGERFTNPCNTQRMSDFVFLTDSAGDGLLAAGKGLHEYEILRGGTNTLAITLLRAVGRLGDWLELATPDAQVQGVQTVQYALGAVSEAALQEAYTFAKEKLFTAQSDAHKGQKPAAFAPLTADKLILTTALKKAEEGSETVVRFFNPNETEAAVRIEGNVQKCRLDESTPRRFDGKVAPKEIVTLKIKSEEK